MQIKVTRLWVDASGNVFAEGEHAGCHAPTQEVPLAVVVGAGIVERIVNTAVELLSHFTEEQLRLLREAEQKRQEERLRTYREQLVREAGHNVRLRREQLIREAGHNVLAVQAPIKSAVVSDTEKAREYYRKLGADEEHIDMLLGSMKVRVDPAKVGEDWSPLAKSILQPEDPAPVYAIGVSPLGKLAAPEPPQQMLDPYAPCPCGSGKKFKWCCGVKAITAMGPLCPKCQGGRVCPRCKGTTKEPLTASGADPCQTCDLCFSEELGYSTGKDPNTCETCGGKGRIAAEQSHPTQSSEPPEDLAAAILQGISTMSLPSCGAGHNKPSGLRVKCVLEQGHDGPHRSGPDYKWERE